ncbi:response regulator transcription factor [Haloferula sp.]|uniref:response regulator transcription factor n=1 Tax=Haloferula sp. TaxID=2497595 RepID=UPI00329FD14E
MSARILIIEDDESLRRGLNDNLTAQGWEVRCASDGELGLELAFEWKADLILLDIMLPKVDGYEICQALRREKIETPILMLTAKGQTDDVVHGLQLGADDYMVKPFALRELLARVQVMLRRSDATGSRYRFADDGLLDVDARRVTLKGEPLELTPKEFDLLTALLRNAGRALTRDQLLAKVWGHGLMVTNRSVDRCVKTLRAKLGSETTGELASVRGIGYRWDGKVSVDT